ncbi:hypothetical protein BKK54_03200 [Rodentibacter genomosp. 1]|uniref:Uncharacterized protein n=1 Tax=Rodentibacter genomosp. 1 TaxID=1908264 RepID=A0A1V3J812_9PAST|nr:hypothetical protein [Rodentibacter genomosp. 1]OOF51431.1 hypothetical protein BKK54_03200 [Rodentibacter genomosp. 1]
MSKQQKNLNLTAHSIKDTDLWAYAMLVKLVKEQEQFIKQVSPALELLGSSLSISIEPDQTRSVLRIAETLLLEHFQCIQDPEIKSLIKELF